MRKYKVTTDEYGVIEVNADRFQVDNQELTFYTNTPGDYDRIVAGFNKFGWSNVSEVAE